MPSDVYTLKYLFWSAFSQQGGFLQDEVSKSIANPPSLHGLVTGSNPVRAADKDGKALEEVEIFTYLGNIISKQGESDADVMARIGIARAAFIPLPNIWNSKHLSDNIIVRIP